jgi:hypothetical protein
VACVKAYQQTGSFHRLIRRTAATRLMTTVYGVVQQPIDRVIYRLTRGRTTLSAWLAGVDITIITTTGAKSGEPRTLPVLGLPDGDDVIVIASNFGRTRDREYQRAEDIFPGFSNYPRWTGEREIPVLRLRHLNGQPSEPAATSTS